MAVIQPGGGTMTPPEPWIGSAMKAATRSAPPTASTFSCSAASESAMIASGASPAGLR